MGHYCWMCGRVRPNEKFSGSGHRRHLCRECAKRPREERERLQALGNITGFLRQRNISAKNRAQLQRLCDSPDDQVRQIAALVLEVARVKPGRRKRRAYLAKHKPDALAQLVQQGLLDDFVEDWGCVSEADEETWADSFDLGLPFREPVSAPAPVRGHSR